VRPRQHPLHAAFTFTTVAVVLLVSGAMGYTIRKSNWSFITGTWSDGVDWWEIFCGAAALLPAVYFWRKGLRDTTHVSSGT
jgi:uncharacterized membrane protein (UPF0136 family)